MPQKTHASNSRRIARCHGRLYSRQYLGSRRIPDLETLRRETGSWKGRVNRDQVKINWKFDRKAARKNLGCKKYSFSQSKT